MTITKLLQLHNDFRYIKPQLAQVLLLFLKRVTRNQYLVLFQKYLKWSIFMGNIFIIKFGFTWVWTNTWLYKIPFQLLIHRTKKPQKKKSKTISTFDFSILYAIILYNLLITVLLGITKFICKSDTRTRIDLSSRLDI